MEAAAAFVLLCSLSHISSAQFDMSQPQITVTRTDTCFCQHGQSACWGNNDKGQLGRGNTDSIGDESSHIGFILDAIDLGNDFVVKQVAGGSQSHHCAVSIDYRLKCWGWNHKGMHTVYAIFQIICIYSSFEAYTPEGASPLFVCVDDD